MGRIEVLAHVSSLQPGQFAGWGDGGVGFYIKGVLPADMDCKLSFREPLMPGKVGCILMEMSNVSSRCLRILFQGN